MKFSETAIALLEEMVGKYYPLPIEYVGEDRWSNKSCDGLEVFMSSEMVHFELHLYYLKHGESHRLDSCFCSKQYRKDVEDAFYSHQYGEPIEMPPNRLHPKGMRSMDYHGVMNVATRHDHEIQYNSVRLIVGSGDQSTEKFTKEEQRLAGRVLEDLACEVSFALKEE